MADRVSNEWLAEEIRKLEASVTWYLWKARIHSALCELRDRRAQRCETCNEWMTVSGPDECPWMFGICPEDGYCFHWEARDE